MNPTKREFLAGAAAAATLLPPAASRAEAPEGLGAIAQRAGIVFGAAAARETLSDAGYRRLYLDEARLLTTDYALKFDALRPSEGEFRFEGADALIEFAEANTMQRRGHTLVWNENAPDWLKGKSKAEKARIFDAHIDRVVERYKGRITIWDVVNEPFWPGHGLPGGYRQGPWYEAFGPQYVIRALKRAGAIDKTARLAINEAHAEPGDAIGRQVRAGMLALIEEVQQAGAPLHAIGLQGHLLPTLPEDDDGFLAFLQRIAARGLEIHITEFDVDDGSYPDDFKARDAIAAERTYRFFSKVLTVPAVKIVASWELSDLYSWYRDPSLMRRLGTQRPPRPLPFDDRMQKKPMWQALARAFSERKAA